MYNEEEIEDSLEFCRQIREYYEPEEKKTEKKGRPERVDLSNVPLEKIGRPTSESYGLRLVNNLFILLVCILVAYFLASMMTHYVAYQTTVEGQSMEPALSNGDSIIIEKVSYYFGNPKRYDVIVFPVKNAGDEDKVIYYVKRVIGLPGEEIQIRDGKVYIDGRVLEDDTYCLSKILKAGNAQEPVRLGKGNILSSGITGI